MRKLTPAEITCIASSRKEPSKGCEKVTFQSGTLIFLNGQAFDNRELEPSFWASNGQGVGARIRANFARPVKIVKLKVRFFLRGQKLEHESCSDPAKARSFGG